MKISSETDRAYLNTTAKVEILDPQLGRKIVIEKKGSKSTVVWNPWTVKAQQMPDFGNDEYQRMVCVESGNVGTDAIILAPGGSTKLTVKVGSESLGESRTRSGTRPAKSVRKKRKG